jgi:hypothetical protein
MAERNLGVRSFETRLAAMDRRLEEIREELSSGGGTWLGRDEGDAVDAGLATEHAEQSVRAERPVVQEPTPEESGVSHEPLRRLLVPSTDDPAAFAMLGGLCASLVESTRRLLDGFEAVLAQVSRPAGGEGSPAPEPATAPSDPRPPGSRPELGRAGSDKTEPGRLTMTAGPFASTESLREFERTLAGLPGVRDVALRGYEPANRAILEVQLEEQTS